MGYRSQPTQEPAEADPGVNLWSPVDDATDHGARGRFDQKAHPRSLQGWSASRLPAPTGPALGAAALVAAAVGLARLADAARRRR